MTVPSRILEWLKKVESIKKGLCMCHRPVIHLYKKSGGCLVGGVADLAFRPRTHSLGKYCCCGRADTWVSMRGHWDQRNEKASLVTAMKYSYLSQQINKLPLHHKLKPTRNSVPPLYQSNVKPEILTQKEYILLGKWNFLLGQRQWNIYSNIIQFRLIHT